MIGQLNYFGKTKVQVAIDRIIQFEPEEGYYLGFSGGKDSIVIYDLCKKAGVKFDAHHNHTTIGSPEQVYFIRDNYKDVIIDYPETTIWELIVKQGVPPTRLMRYCCSELKERGGEGRFKILGLRWAESNRRKKNRKMVEVCFKNSTRTLNPIIDWTEAEVWQYIKANNLKYPACYDEGYKRLGCVLCPQQTRKYRQMDIKNYPKFVKNYIRAFDRMLEVRKEKGLKTTWSTGEEVFNWWISQ